MSVACQLCEMWVSWVSERAISTSSPKSKSWLRGVSYTSTPTHQHRRRRLSSRSEAAPGVSLTACRTHHVASAGHTALNTRGEHITSKEEQPVFHAVWALQPFFAEVGRELAELGNGDLRVLCELLGAFVAALLDISLPDAVHIVKGEKGQVHRHCGGVEAEEQMFEMCRSSGGLRTGGGACVTSRVTQNVTQKCPFLFSNKLPSVAYKLWEND